MRLFIAIEIPKEIKEFLSELNTFTSPIEGVNFVQKDNFHITLKFLGEVEEKFIPDLTDLLKSIAEEFSDFTLKITNPGVFPDKFKPRVIWIGTENTDILKKLAKKIDDELSQFGFQREEREFKSHITLARVKNHQNGKYVFEKILRRFSEKSPDFQFRVKDFVLMKSTLTPKGSIYHVLQRFLLLK
ncbi:2'-5' RNA ligase [Thermodesulfovibrio sp. N1]|uniref:RNA 2',3'-cyclic phosphodiesterase n=1 Tax=unclassified Thermodesulfovibrio TaxID=2645936 RepID=UPI00083A08BB|nr:MULTISPECIES: RNA 2',3'-cyclic phosphodiesterase [unclassified Thermodesulfovibrio]MDI1472293.1 RNA 2',3'-cyclic phosphodiesterase [Thermodesulfovibrio sp. 1176]ODA44943.1 2'-5' RNA ligase [Thermodesulfovibrio sp. N1]